MTIPVLEVHPLTTLSFYAKESQPEEDPSVASRIQRLADQYEETGMRRSVEAVIVVHVSTTLPLSNSLPEQSAGPRSSPHLDAPSRQRVLQTASVPWSLTKSRLINLHSPGGYLDPSESDEEGLLARLVQQIGPIGSMNPPKEPPAKKTRLSKKDKEKAAHKLGWSVGECLSTWYRPHFDGFMYPYIPAHVSKPKEIRKLYLVNLAPDTYLSIPLNMKILAIPLFELYDNAARYGPQLAGVPHILSRFQFSMN
ncbi:cleavage and polyadenylation specificity factor subunit 5, partial [Tremellales sp. Uapishka_1]